MRLIGFIQVACFAFVPLLISLLLNPVRSFQLLEPIFIEGFQHWR
jgi:hypothetical protein